MRRTWADVLSHLLVAAMEVIERSRLFDVTKILSPSSRHLQMRVLLIGMSVLIWLGIIIVHV